MEDDTIKLLRECNAGVKMGIEALDELLPHVSDKHLKALMTECKDTHSRLGEDTHQYLTQYGDDGKEPNLMAKMMSWMKTNFKINTDESDSCVADLLTDGCNMGVKSLHQYLNQYKAADPEIKKLTTQIIEAEETMIKQLQAYL